MDCHVSAASIIVTSGGKQHDHGGRLPNSANQETPNALGDLIALPSEPLVRLHHPRARLFARANRERKRTVQLGRRERRGARLHSGPEPAVSGSLQKSDHPKTPRNRVFFRVDGRCEGRVSTAADYMAVGEVWGELVSRVRSLFSRENTGKFSETLRFRRNQMWVFGAFSRR